MVFIGCFFINDLGLVREELNFDGLIIFVELFLIKYIIFGLNLDCFVGMIL